MTHRKTRNGYKITLKKWSDTVEVYKNKKLIKSGQFYDYIHAKIAFDNL